MRTGLNAKTDLRAQILAENRVPVWRLLDPILLKCCVGICLAGIRVSGCVCGAEQGGQGPHDAE